MSSKRTKQSKQADDKRRIIERPRLLARLDETAASTVLIVAPAGYGKTTLFRQWLRSDETLTYTAGSAASDVAALARGLAHTLSADAIDVGRFVDEMLTVLEHPARVPDDVARALLQAVADLPPRTTVVIDEYEKIGVSESADRVIEILHESGRFHLVIASRSRPRWATARRFLYGEVFELDVHELALTSEETMEILGDEEATSEIVAEARGWPAVISLIASAGHLRTNPPLAQSVLYDFVAEEVFNAAPERVRETLLDIALRPPRDNGSLPVVEPELDASAVNLAVATGLAQLQEDDVDLHPLARAFLVDRIRSAGDTVRVEKALAAALRDKDWDHAFGIVRSFSLQGELERLIATSFIDLLEHGRVATLESFAHAATAEFRLALPVVEVIDAEVAFRGGRFGAARALVLSAIERLPRTHALRSHALTLAGTAAFLLFDLEEADCLFQRALTEATGRRDRVAALWGRCQTSLFLERAVMKPLAEEIAREAVTPEERVRAAMAELQTARCFGLRNVDRHAAAAALLPHVANARVRTSFGNICAYIRVLQGRYAEAADVVAAALADSDRYKLSFAWPHLMCTSAAASLGMRHFTATAAALREVEGELIRLNDVHTELNVRVLRARMLLAQHRPEEALVAVAQDWDEPPARMMYGEYLTTRALALAVCNQRGNARKEAARAVEGTQAVEVHVAAMAATSVASTDAQEQRESASAVFAAATKFDLWDPLITAVRASPSLLQNLASDERRHRVLTRMLERSHDAALARRCGLAIGSGYGRLDLLSKREHEVMDLLTQGMRDREIAQTLYIAESTAKRHVHHIREKLNARTRTEAVARYTEMAGRRVVEGEIDTS